MMVILYTQQKGRFMQETNVILNIEKILWRLVFAVNIFKTISYSFPSFSNHFWIRLNQSTRKNHQNLKDKTKVKSCSLRL